MPMFLQLVPYHRLQDPIEITNWLVGGSVATSTAMSIFAKRTKNTSQIPASLPSLSRRSPSARVGLCPPAPHHPMHHFTGQGRADAIGGEGSAGRDLLRHRVLPIADLAGRLAPFITEPVQIDDVEFSGVGTGAGAMDLGYYFTNLMPNGFTNAMGYAAGQPHDTPQTHDIGA